jgi:transposase
VFVGKGRGADNSRRLCPTSVRSQLCAHNGGPNTIGAVSLDMSPAFIKGVTDHLPNAAITSPVRRETARE